MVNRENIYRIQEMEAESKKVKSLNSNLKSEIDNLTRLLDKVSEENKYIVKSKEDNDEVEENKKREIVQKYQISLSDVLHTISKIKNKYHQEKIKMRTEIEIINNLYESTKFLSI